MKSVLRKIYWVFCLQFGIDLRRTYYSVRGVPRFFLSLIRFRRIHSGRLTLFPCLFDWYEEGGSANHEYFSQDLFVAQHIFKCNPAIHLDVGSRVDGFVAHVASFRSIEVLDVRPISAVVKNIRFRQENLTADISPALINYADSVSCLHALEHFGLGRYGDPLDPDGFNKGFCNLARILKPGGILYLSVPVGVERVEFNAQRVSSPKKILELARTGDLVLEEAAKVYPDGKIVASEMTASDWAEIESVDYLLCIFVFRKALI